MRMNFESNLKKYTDNINNFGRDLSKDGRAKAKEEKQIITESIAEKGFTNQEAESKIYDLQKSKLEKLSKFKKWLEKTRNIDKGTFVHPEQQKNLPVISADQGNFEITQLDGKKTSITIGEIMTDYEWNIDYTFDSSVNIHDIRLYYLNQLKDDLREKLDDQIIISETNFTRGSTATQGAYHKIAETMEKGNEQQGIIAEKMVKNFLKKLAFDTNADFEIIDANVYQDVEQKIDFIIHHKSHERNRGANITESETAEEITFYEDIGVQFTINTDATDHKNKQIDSSKKRLQGVDNIVLVTLPANQASHLYQTWKKNPQSGGPEKKWTKDVQEAIFRGVMTKVLTPDEINVFCTAHFK